MSNSSHDAVAFSAANKRWLVRTAVAAAIYGGLAVSVMAAEPAAAPAAAAADAAEPAGQLEEVQVTGSRIVRKDLSSNSPLVTVDRQRLEDSSFVSIEEALNDLPQFMAGGVGNSGASVTTLQGANGLDGGRGSGDAFNSSLLPDNAGIIGIVVPGAATVNLRGLGANRSLTLIDGHRGMPSNASLTVDLNTIPTVAIGSVEVITGGASAVYGADALAGVTNIKLRQNYEGMQLRVRGGINEVGDGEEFQVGGLMGARIADGRGHVMIGLEYTKREPTYWANRSFFREVMDSPYSSSGDFGFGWDPFYSPGGATGTYNLLQRAWSGNTPSQAAVNAVFSDRNCTQGGVLLDCVGTNPVGGPLGSGALTGGFIFNQDGSLYVRHSQTGTNSATSQVTFWGPQSYLGNTVPSVADPDEVTCTYSAPASGNLGGGIAGNSPYAGQPCATTVNRVDYGRWLSLPREAYTMIGSGEFDFNDSLTAFANFNVASSDTYTRREPAPFSGGFGAIIPFHANSATSPDAIYLPSVVPNPPVAGQIITRAEYLTGGSRGTTCAPTGGCTMAQAFPVPGDVLNAAGQVVTAGELRRLLESRSGTAVIPSTGTNATNPFRGLNACQQYTLANNLPANAPGVQINPASGAQYLVTMDPNTGQPLSTCGPNAGWQINTQLNWLPPRGTENTGRMFQFATGLRGDLGLSDWTWELYMSYGDAQNNTNYNGFTSYANYAKIISAPNYGRGYTELGVSSKSLTCTSGINPMDPSLVVSQDCIDSIISNQIDRNSLQQSIYEANMQGGLFELPAGEVRASLGASYRKIDYAFTPDSLRVREYVNDTSAGQFASGKIDADVTAKEIYGELLVPLLSGVPGAQLLELELGARSSKYSTGQTTETYKILANWQPLNWARFRGGYNRAERAPNLSELYSSPSGSAQFASAPSDPCRTNATLGVFFGGNQNYNTAANPNRAQLQALCSAVIAASGGGGRTEFDAAPDTWDVAGGAALIVGNPNLLNERGDTWTAGLVMSSPFQNALASRIQATVDWYEARVKDPIEVVSSATVVNTCFNVNGLNPTYSIDDPYGYCSQIRRDPSTGAMQIVYNSYDNLGQLVIRGLDFTMSWNAPFADMGLESVPGSLSLNITSNYLIDQIQRYAPDRTDDFAGYGGASKFRASTGLSYLWGQGNRLALTWQYRQGTQTATTFATVPNANGSTGPDLVRNPVLAGYHTNNMFTLTGGTRFGKVNASLTINNLLDTAPSRGGYDLRDPMQGFGSFSPFDDSVGRRYSVNLSVDF